MQVKGREIYWNGSIFAATPTCSAEEAVRNFKETIAEDGIIPPTSGEGIPVRDFGTLGEETDWYEVICP